MMTSEKREGKNDGQGESEFVLEVVGHLGEKNI